MMKGGKGGGGGTGANDDGEGPTVPVHPDGSKFIEELKSQIDG